MSANSKQIAGDHYKSEGEQHWDRVWRLYGRGYFVGCATKYLERYHLKNGKQDLEKAIHFIEKLIELEYRGSKQSTEITTLKDPLLPLTTLRIVEYMPNGVYRVRCENCASEYVTHDLSTHKCP